MTEEKLFEAPTAEEARKIAENYIIEETGKIISVTDAKIYEAIHNGYFSVNSPVCKERVRDSVIDHYEDLGYQTEISGNNMIIINW